MDYLKLVGLSPQEFLDIRSSRRSPDEVHRILQDWTYFGLLFEVTGIPISIDEFRKESQGKVYLSTANLTYILEQWIQRDSQLSTATWIQRGKRLSDCLTIVAEVYDAIYRTDPEYLDPAFHLSVQLLCEYIVRASSLLDSKIDNNSSEIPPVKWRNLIGSERLIKRQMRESGWCTSTIHMLQESVSVTELVFVSLLNRPGPEKLHSKCNANECLAYQVTDEKTYITKHATPACDCEFVYAAQDSLVTILCGHTPSVPLITSAEPFRSADGRLYVNLVPSIVSNDFVKYVAISHVWSDGLGNNANNAIPLCQYRRIVNLVSYLDEENQDGITFWLDTLCFPLAPPEAYNQALIRMRQSYEDAYKVLVFDGYLLGENVLAMPFDEVALRVICSPWNRRLWTLQEGMLARTLIFQFRDTYIDLGPWLQRQNGYSTTLQSLMFCNTWRSYASLRVFETEPTRKMNIKQAKKALNFRSTSVSDDEPLCLGNLLGVDAESVARAGSNGDPARIRIERMKLIWKSLPQQFSSTIFWNAEKMNDEGFRWAPASLMGYGHGNASTCSEEAHWEMGRGLIVTLPGIIFSRASVDELRSFRILTERNARLIVQWERVWSASSPAGTRKSVCPATGKFAILLIHQFNYEAYDLTDTVFFAELCVVLKESESRIYVQLLDRVRVSRVEHLLHHPDLFIGKEITPETIVSLRDSVPMLPRPLRIDKIWETDDTEIGKGSVLDEATWCIN
ncbi:hypothetical protein F5Y02DRAFT_376426 [Annulohypoxylon stygium]|nr:hypothetical protein F5Y02DRAFT_376426 [Annulohypoxylon stygium]